MPKSKYSLDTQLIEIRYENGESESLNFVGWNKKYTKLYLMSKEGERLVLVLDRIVASKKIAPLEHKKIKWNGDMFPDSNPTSIKPTRLLPPPCQYKNTGPPDENLPEDPTEDQILKVCYNTYAYVTKTDLPLIKKLFKVFCTQKDKDYNSLTTEDKEAQREKYTTQNKSGKVVFYWQLTLDDELETNATGTRDKVISDRWLKERNLDRELMHIEYQRFIKLLALHSDMPFNDIELNNKYLLLLATQVKYKITFSCKSESWVFNIKELRRPNHPGELSDINVLTDDLPKTFSVSQAAYNLSISKRSIIRYCEELNISKHRIDDTSIKKFRALRDEKKRR